MEITDNLLKLLGIFSTAFALYMLIREAPFKLRSGKVSTEGLAFDQYKEAMNELKDRDTAVNELRDRLDIETQRGDDQEEDIKQLRRQANTQQTEIQRIERRAKRSDAEAKEYKSKWEAVSLEARNLVREVKILRAVLLKHGLLTPAIEAEIAAGLEMPPDSTPPEGTPSVVPPAP